MPGVSELGGLVGEELDGALWKRDLLLGMGWELTGSSPFLIIDFHKIFFVDIFIYVNDCWR